MAFKLPPGVRVSQILADAKVNAVRRRGKNSKAKGKQFEKTVAEAIAARVNLPMSDVVRARSGTDEADVSLSAEAKKRWPYWPECKNHRTLHLPEWIRQAETTCARRGEGLTPIVVFKQHGSSKIYVCVEWNAFMDLSVKLPE